MQSNVGSVDRAVRAAIATVAVVAGFYAAFPVNYAFWVVGAVLLFTAITGFCGFYRLLGISTCPVRPNEK